MVASTTLAALFAVTASRIASATKVVLATTAGDVALGLRLLWGLGAAFVAGGVGLAIVLWV